MTGDRGYCSSGPVTLELVDWGRHELLLTQWLQRPHVRRWWGDAQDRLDELRATPESEHALIAVQGNPVGYLRCQTVNRQSLDRVGLLEIPDRSVDIDILLGEPDWMGRGIGPAALRLLLRRLARNEQIPLAGLCTSVDNAVAIRAFEKAGFRKLRKYDDATFGRCWVLVAELQGGDPIHA